MIFRPWLWLPPEISQAVAPWGLKAWASLRSHPPSQSIEWRPFSWRGLHFHNPLGLAAGLDKDARDISAWWKFGVGFAEVGTIVPEPQTPNPGKIIDRDFASRTVWNKMGFPSRGMEFFAEQLSSLSQPHPTPLFVNIGKNRHTPLEKASQDYCLLIQRLHNLCEGFVINISSPNTQGLRNLLTPQYMSDFLGPLFEVRNQVSPRKPLLLKLSPDLSDSELESVLQTSQRGGIDGWVITNTTVTRPEGSRFSKDGGLSGAPLASLSRKCLSRTVEILGKDRGDRLIVSVGGIQTWKDIQDRLNIGANLVEIYSALIFEGPLFFERRLKELRHFSK